jgi:hypothetical protein
MASRNRGFEGILMLSREGTTVRLTFWKRREGGGVAAVARMQFLRTHTRACRSTRRMTSRSPSPPRGIAGLGQEQVNYTLTADATAIYACINGGNNHPKAANKETTAGQVSAGGTFTPENGRVQASLTAGPLSAGDFTCPSGQRLVLAQVTYTNIVLTDTTNNVTAHPADVCRSFFPTLFPAKGKRGFLSWRGRLRAYPSTICALHSPRRLLNRELASAVDAALPFRPAMACVGCGNSVLTPHGCIHGSAAEAIATFGIAKIRKWLGIGKKA